MSLKIGDKIEIKKQEKETSLEKIFKDILLALNSRLNQNEKLKWCDSALAVLESWYKEDEIKSVKVAKNRFIPIMRKLVEGSSLDKMSLFFEYYKRTYCFCARRDFECFVDYIEWNMPKKVLAKRRSVLKPYVDSLNRIAFDDNLKYLIVSYAPSMGKCIDANTPVYTPKGNVPIKNLNIGDEVYSMKNKNLCVEKITNKWETVKKQVKITLKSGKQLIVSPEHRMLTFDGYKMAKDITTNDYLYSLLSAIEHSNSIDIDELIFITGMIFEGHCKKRGMSYTGESNEMTDAFLCSCRNLDLKWTKDNKPNNNASTYRILQGNTDKSIKLLKKYGIYGHLAYTKRLPQCFFTMPLRQRYYFIEVMLATDGYITKHNAGISLANEKLINDIQMLLNSCGIYAHKSKKKIGKFTAWELIIPKEYVYELRKHCCCYHKDLKLFNMSENIRLDRGNLSVKYPKQIFRNLKPRGIRGGYNKKWHMERDNDRTLKMFDEMSKVYNELEEYRYKDFYWEEIVNVEYSDEEIDMIDIEVSNTHNFIANGYVSHNSYLATLFTAWGYGLSINNSVIRMSYSDELVLGFSRTIKGIISSPEFAEIFPLFRLYEGKPFEVERESDWKIKNANVPKSNHISRTRNGSTTGERASFAIIFDDMTKGAEEANSESTHRSIYNKWNTEWWNRRDGEKCKFIFVGTQWTPEDILNRIITDRNKVSKLINTDNPYVMESEDKSTVVIRVPMLDDNHKTTCSEVYPQDVAEQIERNTDPFLFSCVYQQCPIAPTGREFAWENIRTYNWDDYSKLELTNNSMATLDTARKGKDNVSMPIFKNDNNRNHYLVDAIYKQKAMDDLYDEIIEKIVVNQITTLIIENNIDTSLKRLLLDRLSIRGIYWCTIVEKFNTVKKEERIKNNRGIVQKQIVFPDKSIIKPNTDIGRMMDNITKYSFDKPNLHDDGIDSVCMYASEIILGKGSLSKPEAIKRPF